MCPTCDSTFDYWRLSGSCLYSQLTFFFDNYSTIIPALITSAWANILMVCPLIVFKTRLRLGHLWVHFAVSIIYSHYYCICLLAIYAQQTFFISKKLILPYLGVLDSHYLYKCQYTGQCFTKMSVSVISVIPIFGRYLQSEHPRYQSILPI